MNRDTDGLGDIDIDVCSSKVQTILAMIRKERSHNFNQSLNLTKEEIESLGATYVCTFGTESAKSAVLTACRGFRSEDYPDGIDVDTAQYLSSLIPSERGFTWSIHDCYYGNIEKDRKPIATFKNEIDKYPGLIDILFGIEGCISRRGRHASGVLFNGEDPYEFNAYMKTPSGEVVTQYDLHDAEWAGSVKMDILVTEVQDKITETISLMKQNGEIESYLTLKEAYDKYLHPDILPLEDMSIWKVIQNAATLDMFQLDSDIGRQGAKKVKPKNMIELSSTNALIRLMTTEKNTETWLERYVKYKNDTSQLEKDISKYNLTQEEQKTFEKYVGDTFGIGLSQEQFMRAVMDKDICNFTLKEANKGRKVISKKKMSEIPILKEQIFSKAKNDRVANYVWDWIVAPGLGYSFSDIHSLSYSFIGFQTAYLATKWNPIYWNTACLIVNSGSLENDEIEEDTSIYEKEKDVTSEDLSDKIKKTNSTDYAKIAKALGQIISKGIKISLIDINNSDYGFKPDIKNNSILFGLKALSGMNDNTIEQIKKGRPYKSICDFMQRCPLNKTAMISLIKGGAFDNVDRSWTKSFNGEPRKITMAYYLSVVSEPKKKLTLQNFKGLMDNNIFPKELDDYKLIYELNKALKSSKFNDLYIFRNDNAIKFYIENFNSDSLIYSNGAVAIPQKIWDKLYKNKMEVVKAWLIENQEEALYKYNEILFKENWEKYASGNISYWEMESLCFYYHEHELANINKQKYGISNFFNLTGEIDYFFKRNGRQIPIYKIDKIVGTVLSKDDTRASISLLTLNGVVNVKFTKEYYAMFNRQLSKKQEDGTKKRIEKGWFGRGTKLLVQGFRRDDTFVAKTYSNTPGHQLYKIQSIDEKGDIILTHERAEVIE